MVGRLPVASGLLQNAELPLQVPFVLLFVPSAEIDCNVSHSRANTIFLHVDSLHGSFNLVFEWVDIFEINNNHA